MVLHYLLTCAPESGAHVLTCLDGVTVYMDGHLCARCDAAVEEVLARRCEAAQRKAWTEARTARRNRTRPHMRGKR